LQVRNSKNLTKAKGKSLKLTGSRMVLQIAASFDASAAKELDEPLASSGSRHGVACYGAPKSPLKM